LWLDRVQPTAPPLTGPADFTGGLPVWIAQRIYGEFLERDPLCALAIEGLALQLLTEVCRGPRQNLQHPPPAWLRQVRDLLEARFAESFSLSDLAAAVGVNPDYLAVAFRKQYGRTVGEFVRKRRIEYACRQMTAGEMSLAEIALAAGFCDQSHFIRSFRRYLGMTPTEYQTSLHGYKRRAME